MRTLPCLLPQGEGSISQGEGVAWSRRLRAIAHGVRSLHPGQVRGVLGVLILDGAGAVIRTTMDEKDVAKYSSPVAQRLQRTLTLTRTLTPTLSLTLTLTRWRSCCSEHTGWSA